SGWYSAKAMIRLIKPSVLRGEQALEEQVPVHHHLVGRGDAAEHRLVAVADRPRHDRAARASTVPRTFTVRIGGHVLQVADLVDPQTRTVKVRGTVDAADERLKAE